MSQFINGTGSMGCGINLMGDLSRSSLKAQLFEMTPGSETVQINGETYEVPKSLSYELDGSAQANSFQANTYREYKSAFDAKTKISGKYLQFSGSVEASFKEEKETLNSSSFGLLQVSINRYWLKIKNQGEMNLSSALLNDPDYQNVPRSFSKENAYLFYRFFNKFGTGYVSEVVMGGSLDYNIRVKSDYSFDSQAVSTKVTAEYNGVFKVGGEASADWKVASKQWFSETSRKVHATGGNTAIVAAVSPEWGISENDSYESWLKSVENSPVVLMVGHTSIAEIFSGDQRKAVQTALAAFQKETLECLISMDKAQLRIGDQHVYPIDSIVKEGKEGFWMMAAIDRTTLRLVEHSEWPCYLAGAKNNTNLYNKMYREWYKHTVDDSKFVLFIAANMNIANCPTAYYAPDFYPMLVNCGGGPGLAAWDQIRMESRSYPKNRALYCLVGIPGGLPGSGIEIFSPPSGFNGTGGPSKIDQWVFLDPIPNEAGDIIYDIAPVGLAEKV